MTLEELKSKYEKMLKDLPDTTPEFRAKRVAFKIGYDIVSAILEKFQVETWWFEEQWRTMKFRTTISKGRRTFKVGTFSDTIIAFNEADELAARKGWAPGSFKKSFEKVNQ